MDIKIKQKEALQLIKEGKYKEFFNLIDQLNFKDWLRILLPKNPKEDKGQIVGNKYFIKGFWSEIIKSKHLSELINNEKFIDKLNLLFDYYFSREENANRDFNNFVSEIEPHLFIKKFKTSKFKLVYNEKFIDSIRQFTISENKELKLFSEFVIYIHNTEKHLWQQFEKNIEIWLNLKPIELLAYASYWFETKEHPIIVEQPHSIINILLSYYFINKKIVSVNCTGEFFYESTIKILHECVDNQTNQYFSSLERLNEWHSFTEDIISVYLHNDNYFLSETKYSFHLNCKDTFKEVGWKTVGNKIKYLPLFVELSYSQITVALTEKNKSKIKGKTENDKFINEHLTQQNYALSMLWETMQFADYDINGIKVPVDLLTILLNGFITIAKEKFFSQIYKLKEEKRLGNLEAVLFKLLNDKIEDIRLPLRWGTIEDFNKVIENNTGLNNFEEVRAILCFNPKTHNTPKKFNRFIPFVNMLALPFFELNGCIIHFENFIGKQINAFNIIRENLFYHTKKRIKNLQILRPRTITQKKDTEFETYIKEHMFSGFYFEQIDSSKKINPNGNNIGEIDLYIYHEGTLLLVELKRTHFRRELSELYYEQKKITEHASHQLIKITEFLKDDANYEWIKDKKNLGIDMQKVNKILPLIITTSMEQDGEMINGILKKNFFEFNFHALFFNRELDNILQKFYDVLKEDEIWKNLAKEFLKMDKDFIIYQQPEFGYKYRMSFLKKGITPDDIPINKDEYKQFDIGNEYYEKKDFKNAITHFEKAHIINPYEATYLDSIANCLAELGQKETAMQLYDKALRLRKDYIIWQNMLVTAKELDANK